MENTRVYDIVASGPRPGKETEYLEWYNEHVETAFQFKGITRVLRLSCSFQLPKGNYGNCPQYLTLYEFENKEAMDAFFKSPMMNPPDTAVDKASLKFEMYWAGGYKPIKTLDRWKATP